MFTLGYAFKPWLGAKSIADGASILDYIRETAREHGVADRIRYHRRVVAASWSSDDATWTVDIDDTETGTHEQLSCSVLFTNTGYYNYEQGYTPGFPGIDDYAGEVIHPQHWPDHVDYAGKRVVVIGSGATAVTLVPALAEQAEHVVMLQRSPSYIATLPAADPIADLLRRALPDGLAYSAVRWKNVAVSSGFFQLCRRAPGVAKRVIRTMNSRQLPSDYPVDVHFKPSYDPWDQRLCLVPDGDLFRAIRHGRASVVTDTIDTFTEKGIRLASGTELEADIVVTATGLNLKLLGGMQLRVDGKVIDLAETIGYKGMSFCDVPNLVATIGYTNASWTLKADLVADYVCRLINHMDRTGTRIFVPQPPAPGTPTHPFIDLASGYVLRSLDELPKQGDTTPWRLHQNYVRDIVMLKRGPVTDKAMRFVA
jgi:cation diffusion facilitator CzcD-associated flavoprotein CzcO